MTWPSYSPTTRRAVEVLCLIIFGTYVLSFLNEDMRSLWEAEDTRLVRQVQDASVLLLQDLPMRAYKSVETQEPECCQGVVRKDASSPERDTESLLCEVRSKGAIALRIILPMLRVDSAFVPYDRPCGWRWNKAPEVGHRDYLEVAANPQVPQGLPSLVYELQPGEAS